MLASYDSKDVILKTLPLVFQCKIFRWWVCNNETISTNKFAFLIVTLWIKLWETEHYFRRSLFALVLEFFLVRIFLYSDWIQENTDRKKLRIWTLFTQWHIRSKRSFYYYDVDRKLSKMKLRLKSNKLRVHAVKSLELVLCSSINKSSRLQMFFKIYILKNFVKFKGKHLC